MITFQQFKDEVCKLARENPTNIYTRPKGSDTCSYSRGDCTNGSTGCLFGQALRNLKHHLRSDSDSIDRILVNELGIDDLAAITWAYNVQRRQDRGLPWGKCI